MLKLIVSCGMGMSSSALTLHMKKEIEEKGWVDKVSIDYVPFPLLMEGQDTIECDLAFLCPHLMYYAKNEAHNENIKIPMYIIPSLLYGKMNIQDFVEDAIDLLKLYKDSDEKLYHFPEEKLLDIKRRTSHRRWIKIHPI